MVRTKYDGVVEAVHYKPNGEVDWVRAYERRGPTFGDVVLLNRGALVDKLKQGKKFLAGRRVRYQASTFEVTTPLRVIRVGEKDVLVAGEAHTERDHLSGVPVI